MNQSTTFQQAMDRAVGAKPLSLETRARIVLSITKDRSAHVAEGNHAANLVRKTRGQLEADRSAKMCVASVEPTGHFGRAVYL